MCKNIVGRGRPRMTIWRMRIAYWITKATHIHTIRNIYCFSTSTMVARTRPSVTVYVHCLSCFNLERLGVPRQILRDTRIEIFKTHTFAAFFGKTGTIWFLVYTQLAAYVVGSKSFRPDQLFKVTEIRQLCYFST